jgi:hypothetical protein
MRTAKSLVIFLSVLTFGSNAGEQTPAAFRVLFGVTDAAPTRWDGSIKVNDAGQYTLESWQFEGTDNTDGELFHFSTHHGLPGDFDNGEPAVANGFVITASEVNDRSDIVFSTAQGAFSFRPSELPYGRGIYKLGACRR